MSGLTKPISQPSPLLTPSPEMTGMLRTPSPSAHGTHCLCSDDLSGVSWPGRLQLFTNGAHLPACPWLSSKAPRAQGRGTTVI